MNNTIKQIKELEDSFDEKFDIDWYYLKDFAMTMKKICKIPLDPFAIKSHITQSHLKVIDSLILEFEGRKVGDRPSWQDGDPQWWDECSSGYNQSLSDTINHLKEVKEYLNK